MGSENLESAFTAAWPVERWQDVTVVVGVSGGADSVALLRQMSALRAQTKDVTTIDNDFAPGNLVAVHVNHRLRGDASDGDEQFVVALCESLGVKCIVGQVDAQSLADDQGDGLEAACRSARYEFLLATAERLGARYVAVAHTADDQAETILHHVLRGTGLAGLGGMTAFRPMSDAVTLARPLLAVRRADVIAYLTSLGQTWRDDETNRQPQFTRNRIRQELIPQLSSDYNAEVVPALARLGRQAREAHAVVRAAAEQLLSQCTHVRADDTNGHVVEVDCPAIAAANRHVLRETFVAIFRQRSWPRQAMRFKDWDALAAMALGESPEANRTFPGEVAASRSANTLTLKRRSQR